MPSPSVSLGTRLLVVGFTRSALDQLPKAGSTDGPPAGLPLARGGGQGLGVSQAGPGLPRSLPRMAVSRRLLDLRSSLFKVTSHNSLFFSARLSLAFLPEAWLLSLPLHSQVGRFPVRRELGLIARALRYGSASGISWCPVLPSQPQVFLPPGSFGPGPPVE